jgi:Tol biopolymer transport system component
LFLKVHCHFKRDCGINSFFVESFESEVGVCSFTDIIFYLLKITMKKLALFFAMIALAINSCSDSSVDSTQKSFDGTIYYLSFNQAKLFRVNSAGKQEINTAKSGVHTFPSAPVGNKLFYILIGGEGTKPLVITDTEGTTTAPFTISDNTHALLSPNGNHVAYIEEFVLSNPGITIYNTVTKSSIKLPISNVLKKDIIFSPDGNKIAYFKGQFGDSLFISNIDGTNQELIFTKVFPDFIDWSPNGEKIAYSVSGNIGVVNVTTKENKTILTENKSKEHLKWMPDSKNIVYSYNTKSENINETSIQMLDTESGVKKDLITSKNLLLFPQISPDGKSILYTEVPVGKFKIEGSLKILNLTTSQTVKIADDAYNGFWKK